MSSTSHTELVEIELKVFDWSTLLDILRVSKEKEEGSAGFFDNVNQHKLNCTYNYLGRKVEEEIEIGEKWSKITTIEMDHSMAQTSMFICKYAAEKEWVTDKLGGFYVNPEVLAMMISTQYRNKTMD